jgi:hypothetical protein
MPPPYRWSSYEVVAACSACGFMTAPVSGGDRRGRAYNRCDSLICCFHSILLTGVEFNMKLSFVGCNLSISIGISLGALGVESGLVVGIRLSLSSHLCLLQEVGKGVVIENFGISNGFGFFGNVLLMVEICVLISVAGGGLTFGFCQGLNCPWFNYLFHHVLHQEGACIVVKGFADPCDPFG